MVLPKTITEFLNRLTILLTDPFDRWFLAVLNGPEARTVKVPLAFLGPGQYRAMLARDHKSDPAAVEIENTAVQRTGSLTLELSSGGGFIARLLAH